MQGKHFLFLFRRDVVVAQQVQTTVGGEEAEFVPQIVPGFCCLFVGEFGAEDDIAQHCRPESGRVGSTHVGGEFVHGEAHHIGGAFQSHPP